MPLSKDEIKAIGKAVAAEVTREHKTRTKQEQDYRLRNTGILLREYRKLEAHVQANPESYLSSDEYEALSGRHIEEHDLARYHVKTKNLMHYVDNALEAYKALCQGGDGFDHRRWTILYEYWLGPHKTSQTTLSARFDVDHTTIGRELSRATQDISVILFGVAGLEDFLKTWVA